MPKEVVNFVLLTVRDGYYLCASFTKEQRRGRTTVKITGGFQRITCPSCDTPMCNCDCDGSQGADNNNHETEEEAINRCKYNAFLHSLEEMIAQNIKDGININAPTYVEGINFLVESLFPQSFEITKNLAVGMDLKRLRVGKTSFRKNCSHYQPVFDPSGTNPTNPLLFVRTDYINSITTALDEKGRL